MQKLEIELDNVEYSQSFSGRFVSKVKEENELETSKPASRKIGFLKRAKKTSKDENVKEIVVESVIKIEVITDGFTKTLRIVEKKKDETIDKAIGKSFKIINNIKRKTMV